MPIILFLLLVSATALCSAQSYDPKTGRIGENVTVEDRVLDEAHRVWFGAGYLGALSYAESISPIMGPMLVGYARKDSRLHQLEVSRQQPKVDVLAPYRSRSVDQLWDLIYTWDTVNSYDIPKFKQYGQFSKAYFQPAFGLRLKEKLEVTCRNKRTHCFHATYRDWDIEERKETILPLIGFRLGGRVVQKYFIVDTYTQLATDTEDTYLSVVATVGFSAF